MLCIMFCICCVYAVEVKKGPVKYVADASRNLGNLTYS